MSSGSAKAMKKQAMKEVSAEMNARLDKIENFCQAQLDKQDKRARSIQSWIIQEVSVKIQNDLFNATCTVDAIVEVLAKNNVHIEDFAKQVDEQKVLVAERKKLEAEEAMKAQLQAQQDALAAQAAAEAAAQAEAQDNKGPGADSVPSGQEETQAPAAETPAAE